jgi:two-component system nitrate/nitrite response regulator NarL
LPRGCALRYIQIMNHYRVLVVAGDPLARAGLAARLAGQDGCTIVGQVAADDRLPDNLDIYRPDVVVWDLGWDPDPAALPDLGEGGPPVLALLPDPSQAADAWTAGARGLLLRTAAAAHLLTAITAVGQGLAVLDPALAGALPLDRPRPPAADLTPREIEVVRLLAEGLSNKAVAQRLSISEHTVKFHINAILGKLNAQSRTEAVVHAIRLGLIAV